MVRTCVSKRGCHRCFLRSGFSELKFVVQWRDPYYLVCSYNNGKMRQCPILVEDIQSESYSDCMIVSRFCKSLSSSNEVVKKNENRPPWLFYPEDFHHWLTIILSSWEIPPQSEEKRAASAFKLRQGEENGTRIYQLVLHNMILLPSNVPTQNVTSTTPVQVPPPPTPINLTTISEERTHHNVNKGKKRAFLTPDSETDVQPKKIHTTNPEPSTSGSTQDIEMN